MKLAKIIAWVCLLSMSAILLFGFTTGNFAADGGELLQNPWGLVSLVDLYSGFALFSIWIIYRRKSWLSAFVWVFLMMTLGFWAGALYTLIALYQSQNNWSQFWKGHHS